VTEIANVTKTASEMQAHRHCADQANIRPRTPAEDGLASGTKNSFGLGVVAHKIATKESNAAGLPFPATVRCATAVFKGLISINDASAIQRLGCDSKAAGERFEEINGCCCRAKPATLARLVNSRE
jgi:hypothetical protein